MLTPSWRGLGERFRKVPANEGLVRFVDGLRHRPTHITESHDLEGKSALKWLHLHYRYPGKKLKGVGKWLVEIRDELTARGVAVRDIKASYHFLQMGTEKDPDCMVTAEFAVNSAQELDDLNNAFLEGAAHLISRMRGSKQEGSKDG